MEGAGARVRDGERLLGLENWVGYKFLATLANTFHRNSADVFWCVVLMKQNLTGGRVGRVGCVFPKLFCLNNCSKQYHSTWISHEAWAHRVV